MYVCILLATDILVNFYKYRIALGIYKINNAWELLQSIALKKDWRLFHSKDGDL